MSYAPSINPTHPGCAAAFHEQAKAANLYAETINGDAFSNELKAQVIDKIKADLGQVDLVIYSLASPRRTDPATGETYKSTLKPVGQAYTTKTYDTDKEGIIEIKDEKKRKGCDF